MGKTLPPDLDAARPARSKPLTTPPAPDMLRGKLAYAAATADVSASGIDAFRDDGASRIVMWKEIVGVVARRLPERVPYDGTTFVDVVSTAGSTLRILPWTRITGEAFPDDPIERARAFVRLVIARRKEAQVDAATRKFIDSNEAAAQLTDPATLAAHDARLA
jgi:hypothetical protein